MLNIKNLNVSFDGKKLLSDINLNIAHGARHLLAGHNGSGKSSLVQTIAGNPAYSIDSGTITFDGRDITNECATTRALLGIFLGAQNVPEIPGLTVLSFLKHSCAAHTHFNTGRDLSMGTSEEIGRKISLKVGEEEMELLLDDTCPVELSSLVNVSCATFGRMRGGTFDPAIDLTRVSEWKTPEGDCVEVPSAGFSNYIYGACCALSSDTFILLALTTLTNIIVVVAVMSIHIPLIKFKNLITHSVKEITVVCHHK